MLRMKFATVARSIVINIKERTNFK